MWSSEAQTVFAEDRMHDAQYEACQHENIFVLVDWMADNGYTPREIADAVEKPWHYLDELADAKAAS